MCGIAGVFDQSGISGSQLAAMAGTIRHRGPDDEGYMLIDRQGTTQYFRGDDTISEIRNVRHINSEPGDKRNIGGFAHRRLSIIDLSPTGHQPLAVDNNKYVIVYNGEIYNFKEIREDLRSKGYDFVSQSDSEVILNAYREWGEKCVNEFVGMWAFAIWDKLRQTVFLSRDRFGIKPLYYFKADGLFAFASEIKSLFPLKFVEKKINESCLYQYIAWGRNGDPEATLFQGIKEFPPGCCCHYYLADNSLRKNSYYDLKLAVTRLSDKTDQGDPVEKYRFLFNHSMDLHLRSDVPVGSCLSGGLDSSSIVAAAAVKMNSSGFNTFTAAYQESDIDESVFARLVCEKYPNLNPFFTYPTAQEFWKDFDRMIWHQDLPIASSSIFAQWEVMKLAREQGMKVLLDGQGADESLGGYSFFVGFYLLDLLKKINLKSLYTESRKLKINRSIKLSREFERALFHYFPSMLKKKILNEKRIAQDFLTDEFKESFKDSVFPEIYGNSFSERCYDSFRFGLRELLRYEDRNSMAFSIESRVPFLEHRLVEYSISLEANMKIRNGWTKYILRKAMENILPYKVAYRKDKKGFVTPQAEWKRELDATLKKFICNYDFPKIFDRDFIIKTTKKNIINVDEISAFWKLISVMKWIEIFKMNA